MGVLNLNIEAYKIGVALVLLVTAFSAGFYARGVIAERDMLKMQNEYQQEVITQQKKVKAYEGMLQSIANQVEKQSYENQKKHDRELAYYRNLVKQSGGLFDNAIQADDSQTTGTPGDNQTTTSGRPLSREAVEFLLQQANKADRVVDQYLQCQQYVFSITGVTP